MPNSKKQIVVIDDKSHALEQIKASMPAGKMSGFEILHYLSFAEYEAKQKEKPEFVFLDFFLDQDRKVGSEFVERIEARYLVGFSSMLFGSQAIYEEALKTPAYTEENTFFLEKKKETLFNLELNELFERVLE